MTTEEAADLIRRAEGTLCVRFYRRRDGTILTQNCPVGLQRIKHRLSRTRKHVIAAVVSFMGYLGLLGAYELLAPRPTMDMIVCRTQLPGPSPVVGSETFVRERAIFKVIPVYHSGGAANLNSDVVVSVVIAEDGTVEEARCTRGTPPLSDLAEEAARRWQFEPVFVDGQATRVESLLTFRFNND
jgi:TonB family protein